MIGSKYVAGRREVLCGAGAILLASRTAAFAGDHAAKSTARVKTAAAAKGIEFGAATSSGLIKTWPQYTALFETHCGVVVPENEGKWAVVNPRPDAYEFDGLDTLSRFAQHTGSALHGHCLVWHRSLPTWVSHALHGGNAELLSTYISTVVGRFRDTIDTWDVVNEAVDPADGRPDGLRKSPWLALGPDYILRAFEVARNAAPNARLAYNDFGIEYATRSHDEKRERVLALLATLRARELIDALGVQSHLWIGTAFDPTVFRKFLADVAALGLEIWLSELDVNDRAVTGTRDERDAAVAHHVRTYLNVALQEPAVRRVVTWGVSTRYSWLNGTEEVRRADRQHTRGLPFDDSLDLTPMGAALLAAFKQAPQR
jgi:endo-1,4-beta-xylanase